MLLFMTSHRPPDGGQALHGPFGVAGTLAMHGGQPWLHRAPGSDPRAAIVAAKEAGATHVVAVEEGLGLNRLLRAGDWLVPDDFIEQTRGQPTTFFERRGMGYLQQLPAFPRDLHAALVAALADAAGAARCFEVGTLLATDSLRRLTPAEARAARLWGADLAVTRAQPEAALAREVELAFALLCHVAATVPPTPDAPPPPWQPASWESIQRITRVIPQGGLVTLTGSNSMARAQLGDDWHAWIE